MAIDLNQFKEYPIIQLCFGREDLSKFTNNRLLLMAVELEFNIEDIDTLASDSLTDGSDDKKCDFLYINEERGVAIIAQGYLAEELKHCAPTNKAADLNTAAAWILNRHLSDIPERLREAASDLRNAIENNKVHRLEFWYVTNCKENRAVSDELQTVEQSAASQLRNLFEDKTIDVAAKEIGLETLQAMYNSSVVNILIKEKYTVPTKGAYYFSSANWSAVSAAIPALWLNQIFISHQDKLFSANVRSYLGSRKDDSNINHGIKSSAEHSPDNFWAYNNGITALVNDIHLNENGVLTIDGISIVNGAQTTGAIGNLKNPPSEALYVPARFIKCLDREIIDDIVRYNNNQNKVEAADFRSTDKIQEQLREEFRKYPDYTYRGGRRGGSEDKIKRPGNLIASDVSAQILASFHQDPHTAYHDKSMIWENDNLYSKYFGAFTHADHLLFCYSLHECIKQEKNILAAKIKRGESITNIESDINSFLRYRGSQYLILSAVGISIESIVGSHISNQFNLRFKRTGNLQELVEKWKPIVQIFLSLSSFLKQSAADGMRKRDLITKDLSTFSSVFAATRISNSVILEAFKEQIEWQR